MHKDCSKITKSDICVFYCSKKNKEQKLTIKKSKIVITSKYRISYAQKKDSI